MTPLYLDVHVPAAIAAELRRRGVDVLTAQEDSTTELDGAVHSCEAVIYRGFVSFAPHARAAVQAARLCGG